MPLIPKIKKRVERELVLLKNAEQIKKIRLAASHETQLSTARPILFFNASTRLSGISQNAGFSLLASLGLQAAGQPIVHFVCERGMSRCVLGTNRTNPQDPPPCAECTRTSGLIFQGTAVESFNFQRDPKLENVLKDLSVAELIEFEYREFSIGRTILPSLRWVLRRHHLEDNEYTRYLAREFIHSAWNIKRRFVEVLIRRNPKAVVVFNGMFFPEATVRKTAMEWNIPVYSHEVGMQPMSAFFTEKEATAYPVDVDESMELSKAQLENIEGVISKRSQGKFETAGVEFWPEMRQFSDVIGDKKNQYKSIVPVFSNVIFDTSQSHANVLFENMFDWLDQVIPAARIHKDTLFVIRAHPDEIRAGKESQESVAEWFLNQTSEELDNVIFIPPDEFISSYDLVNHAKFVMVYNSTIGLEASMAGKAVLCAGRARYTQIPTVFFPKTREAYLKTLEDFLNKKKVAPKKVHGENARRVFFNQYFQASLPFEDFLEDDGIWRGYVQLKPFKLKDLSPDKNDTMKVLFDAFFEGKPFLQDT